jgi:hypothetical protein
MSRVRPTEHKAVLALLDAPAESVEQLACDVIVALDEQRAKRTDFVTVVQHAPGCVVVYGPYVTRNAAEKDIGRSVIADRVGVRYMVLPLSTNVDEGLEL